MGVEDRVTTLDEGQQQATDEVELEYDDVNMTLTAGYKPTIVVSLATIVSFLLLGGVLPPLWGTGDGGYTLFTYTSILWGVVIAALGFVYEYWIRANQNRDEGGDER